MFATIKKISLKGSGVTGEEKQSAPDIFLNGNRCQAGK